MKNYNAIDGWIKMGFPKTDGMLRYFEYHLGTRMMNENFPIIPQEWADGNRVVCCNSERIDNTDFWNLRVTTLDKSLCHGWQ